MNSGGIGSHGGIGSGASVSSISTRRHSNWRSCVGRQVVRAGERERRRSRASPGSARRCTTSPGRRLVDRRRRAFELEGARVAAPVLGPFDAALIGRRQGSALDVDGEAPVGQRMRHRRRRRCRRSRRASGSWRCAESRTPSEIGFTAISAVASRKQVLPVSTLPPSVVRNQSQLPPSSEPPMIVFFTNSELCGCGGMRRHEVRLDHADAAAERRGVLPDREVDEPELAVRVVVQAAAGDLREVPGDRRVLDDRAGVRDREDAAAAPASPRGSGRPRRARSARGCSGTASPRSRSARPTGSRGRRRSGRCCPRRGCRGSSGRRCRCCGCRRRSRSVALLPLTKRRSKVPRMPLYSMPPPEHSSHFAWLFTIVLSANTTGPEPWKATAPPSSEARFRSKCEFVIVSRPPPRR